MMMTMFIFARCWFTEDGKKTFVSSDRSFALLCLLEIEDDYTDEAMILVEGLGDSTPLA